MSINPRLAVIALLFALASTGQALAQAPAAVAGPVAFGDKVTFGYWAPEIHELHVMLPVRVVDRTAPDTLIVRDVRVDGEQPTYFFNYVDDHTIDYGPTGDASERDIRVYIPLAWRPREVYRIQATVQYSGRNHQIETTIESPDTGGAWAKSLGPNQTLKVTEPVGVARDNALLDVDLTLPGDFSDPADRVVATVMTEPGVYEPVPSQVFSVERFASGGGPTRLPDDYALVRFSIAVQLDMQPHETKLVALWVVPAEEAPALRPTPETPVGIEGGAIGGAVDSDIYRIRLDDPSGQLLDWRDKRLATTFDYHYPGRDEPSVSHRTPDVFKLHVPWSHAFDWRPPLPEATTIEGPLLVETRRWGPMPGAEEVHGRIRYRFIAGRPEVRIRSSMRVLEDLMNNGLRMGNMILSPRHVTHAAWPKPDGTIHRIAIEHTLGNDMGAPPQSRFDFDTPWVALYHEETGVGLALVTTNVAYFNDFAHHPNRTREVMYVSLYRGRAVYTIRSATQTWEAMTRSYPTPLHAGTSFFEEAALMPFRFDVDADEPFKPVTDLLTELKHPLVVTP